MNINSLVALIAILASRALFPGDATPALLEPVLEPVRPLLPEVSLPANTTIVDWSIPGMEPLVSTSLGGLVLLAPALVFCLLAGLIFLAAVAVLRMTSRMIALHLEISSLKQELELSRKTSQGLKKLWHDAERKLAVSQQVCNKAQRNYHARARELEAEYASQFLSSYDQRQRSWLRQSVEADEKKNAALRDLHSCQEELKETREELKEIEEKLKKLTTENEELQEELENQVTEAQKEERKAALRILKKAGIFPAGHEEYYIEYGSLPKNAQFLNKPPPQLAVFPAIAAPSKSMAFRPDNQGLTTASEFKALSQRVPSPLSAPAPKTFFSHLKGTATATQPESSAGKRE